MKFITISGDTYGTPTTIGKYPSGIVRVPTTCDSRQVFPVGKTLNFNLRTKPQPPAAAAAAETVSFMQVISSDELAACSSSPRLFEMKPFYVTR
jgi:hypothetical protein